MLAKFDPVAGRDIWLKDGRLEFARSLQADAVPPEGRPDYAQLQTSSMIDAYLVGLASEARPILEQLVSWMERPPAEPDRLVCSGSGTSLRVLGG